MFDRYNLNLAVRNLRHVKLFIVGVLILIASPAHAAVTSYTVAIDAEYAPYEFITEQGEITGYTPSLLRAMQPIMHVKFQFISMNWPDAVKALNSGKVDIISMIENKDRLLQYSFSTSHSDIFQALFINQLSSAKISTLKDLAGKKIAFQANDISLFRLKDRTDFKKVIVQSKKEGFDLLENGDVDGFFTAELAGKAYTITHGFHHYQVSLALGGLFEQRFAFALTKGRTDVVNQLNDALSKLDDNGMMDDLKQQWLLKPTTIWQDHKLIILLVGLVLISITLTSIALKIMLMKNQRRLEKSERMFHALYDDAPIAFMTMNRDGEMKLANKAFLGLLDVRLDDVIGQNFRNFLLITDDGVFENKISELEKGSRKGCSCDLVARGGCLIKARIQVRVGSEHVESDDEINLAIQDMTAITLAEEKNRKLLTAIDKSAEAIAITSPSGSIEFVNQAFIELTGYSAEEAFGKNPRILKSGNQEPEYYQQMWEDLLINSRWQGRIINRKKDGSFYPALLTIAAVRNASNEVVNYIGIQQDMSEMEKLEAQFQQAQKLEAIGTLVAGIAHDFNNSLAAINGNAYLVKSKLAEGDPIRDRMTIIETSVKHSASIIRQLLTFSRKGESELSIFEVRPFLKEFEKFYASVLAEDISFQLLLEITDETIQGDIHLLQQVLNNLVNNAVYAVTANEKTASEISISSCLVDKKDAFLSLQENLANEFYVKISVVDNGCGIAAKDMPHIFEPFYTTKPEGSGSGLGLAMAYGMVSSHHGYIQVESKENERTACSIYFPVIVNDDENNLSEYTQKLLNGNNELILVVDDQDDVLETTTSLLESLGYRVVAASNGAQGLDIFESHKDELRLVITDVVMPVMGGLEMVRRIKKIKPEVKAIFITGYSTEVNSKNIPGVVKNCPFLQKPFNIVAFSRVVWKLLG